MFIDTHDLLQNEASFYVAQSHPTNLLQQPFPFAQDMPLRYDLMIRCR